MTVPSRARAAGLAGWILIAVLAAGRVTAHPHRPIAVKIDPQHPKRLLLLEQGAKTPRILYETSAGALVGAAVSPYFSRVAVLEANGVENRLVVVEAGGRELAAVDRDVRKVAFSPDGRAVAFLTGTHFEGGAGFAPDGAALLDLESGRIDDIAGAEQAYDLDWVSTPREKALYLKLATGAGPSAVARYDLATRRLERLASPVFNLSPDGRYYFSRAAENVELGRCEPGRQDDSCFRLLDRETNREIAFFSRADIGTPHGWVYNEGHQLLVSKKTYQTQETERRVGDGVLRGSLITGVSEARGFVFDVETQQVSEQFECDVSPRGWAGDWVTGATGIPCRDSPQGTYVHTGRTEPAPAPRPRAAKPAGPPPPAAGRPAPGASFNYSNPLFDWREAEGAHAYVVEVCASPACDAGAVVAQAADLRATRWQPESLPKGDLYWRVASSDAEGRTGIPGAPVPFTILSDVPDRTAPHASLTASAAAAAVGERRFHSADARVEAAVADEQSGVKAWFPRINRQPATPEDLGGPWGEPLIDIEVVGEDEAGNRGTAAATTLRVDREPPEIRGRFVAPEQLGRRLVRPRDEPSASLWVTDGQAPGRALLPAPSGGDPAWIVEGDVPQLFIVAAEGWPFVEPPAEQVGARRVLWVDAVDRGAGVVRLVVRIVPGAGGAGSLLRIEATDALGNGSSVEHALR